jgi:hypothetical protein
MRRKLHAMGALVAVTGGSLFLLAGPAGAQTGYPPATCTVTASAQGAGSHNIGDTFTIKVVAVCSFDPGSIASISVNGQNIGTKVVEADGSVIVNVVVQSATSLVINDPVTVSGHCGQNAVVVTGPSSAAKATVTQTATFNVLCPPAGAARPVQGSVAFTGANIARWSAVALALAGVGALLVTASRRRRQLEG